MENLASTDAVPRWESTACQHSNRSYLPIRQQARERLVETTATDRNGRAFVFAHCGHTGPCDCYNYFDGISEPLIVATDAGVRHLGTPNVSASIAVFVGPDSPYNVSEIVQHGINEPSRRAEMKATLRALRLLLLLKQSGSIPLVEQVVVKTDHKSTCDTMTERIFEWRENGYLTKFGQAVNDRDIYWEMEEVVVELYNTHHTAVLFFWTPREFNGIADSLAREALDEGDRQTGPWRI
ncbi:hypothetical protein LTR97_010145 [Elasticomyces elasticus]|uniref:RNase H type-1 domain-containing protein n=1 Tax=Elasticomyces elasticus TaxID=574655 RepID=A0AAN7ZZB4_9PEZI|nr:hypothetical protein LTR97_010145 [Elasticomyces elasticus]